MPRIISIYGVTMALLATSLLVSCDDKEKKLQEQVEALTLEIEQIDTDKKAAEADLDSISKEKERIAEEAFAAKQFGEEQLEKLKQANSALYTARKRNEDLQRELASWKARADSLAAENAQLKAKITELNNRLAAAEQRALEAENRASEYEARFLALQAKISNTYYVSSVAVQATNDKGETYTKDKIPPRADIINVDLKVGRPEGQAAAPLNLTLKVTDPKGGVWFTSPFSTTNDQGRVSINVKENKLDLKSGRYNMEVLEGAASKYKGFFTVN